jgi:precorrin-6A/cobalt-precorrin-6A reductase
MHRPDLHQDSRNQDRRNQDSLRLWLVAGTGEGPELAERLLALGWQLTVSVVSAPAALAYRPHPALTLRVGALAGEAAVEAELAAAASSGHPYAVVVDASHPFACQVSRQLVAGCARRGQRLLRLQRPTLEGPAILLPALQDLRAVPLAGQHLLLAIGARQLAAAVSLSPGALHHARLLPSASSLQQAMAAGLRGERVACLRPGSALAVELALVRRWRISTVLARQSGGSTEQLWRRICRSEGLSLLLLCRPQELAGVESLDAAALLATLADWTPPCP